MHQALYSLACTSVNSAGLVHTSQLRTLWQDQHVHEASKEELTCALSSGHHFQRR